MNYLDLSVTLKVKVELLNLAMTLYTKTCLTHLFYLNRHNLDPRSRSFKVTRDKAAYATGRKHNELYWQLLSRDIMVTFSGS